MVRLVRGWPNVEWDTKATLGSKPNNLTTLAVDIAISAGPLLIGLGLPIEIAPLRSSTSELINLASVAAYSADIIDYKK